jgi:hypothetical protein
VRLPFAAVVPAGCMEPEVVAPTGNQIGNYRHGTRTKGAIQAVRYVNLLSRLARKS